MSVATAESKPKLSPLPEKVRECLAELAKQTGCDVRTDSFNRVLYSTDASIYQVMPYGRAVSPEPEDLQAAVELAAQYGVPAPAAHRRQQPRRAGGQRSAGHRSLPATWIRCWKSIARNSGSACSRAWSWTSSTCNLAIMACNLAPIPPAATAPPWAASSPTTPRAATPSCMA